MASKLSGIELTRYDDLFKTDAEREADRQERIQIVPASEVFPYFRQPYTIDRPTPDLVRLMDSIEHIGIAEPLIVRPRESSGYEIISGHRRDYCAKAVGLDTRPVIVRNYSDEEADILVVDYNINREDLLPSEKAKAYKLKLDAMKRQGQRTDLTSLQLGEKLNKKTSVRILAEQATDNVTSIQRYNERLEELQTADSYDSVSVTGQSADWIEVLAVFAVKVAGADADAADVATMDADRIVRLKAVFWDMTGIATEVETINHPGSGDDDGWTERNLYITITAKTAEEMKTEYHFNRNQIAALDELLEQRDLLRELIEDVYSVSGDTAALIRSLPEGLSPEREAVVRTACSLVGKVNYFWGGKSLVIGWDVRWGELRQVTAAGSSTTGTYRPYGLDCSGFVDWVFYNQSGGSYVIGHGGGATMQHSYCTNISWADAQPGDLVFYPDNSHVGIVGGRDANGELLIIHCASGYNNVVVTGLEGFTSIARPDYYTN